MQKNTPSRQSPCLIRIDPIHAVMEPVLEQAQSCIEAQQDKLAALELRAEIAEAEARQAKEALALVEEAIRKRLLRANPDADGRLTAVA